MPEHRPMRRACSFLLVLACLGLFPAAWGQDVTATLTGTVWIPPAPALSARPSLQQIRNVKTAYTVQTNRAGVFQIPRLPVGTYELKVGAPGFQTAVYRVDYAGPEPDRPRRFPIEDGTG